LGIGQSLGVLDLSSGVLVVKLVAQRSAVGTWWAGGVFHQHRDDLVAGSIIGKFYGNALFSVESYTVTLIVAMS